MRLCFFYFEFLKNKRMNFFLLFAIILFLQFSLFAENPEKKFAFAGYTGGMMVHTGYMKSAVFLVKDTEEQMHNKQIEGMPFGMGGALKFQFGKHFRVGMEGYMTKIVYEKRGSIFRQGWGGVLADGLWKFGKWTPFVGVCFGGGQVTNLLFLTTSSDSYIADAKVAYQQYPVFLFNPSLGIEFSITPKLTLVFKTEYQVSLKKREPDQPNAVRFYFGAFFNRVKN